VGGPEFPLNPHRWEKSESCAKDGNDLKFQVATKQKQNLKKSRVSYETDGNPRWTSIADLVGMVERLGSPPIVGQEGRGNIHKKHTQPNSLATATFSNA